MVKIPLYIKNPNSLKLYQNYSKVLFHNNQNQSGISNDNNYLSQKATSTKLFPVYTSHQETVNSEDQQSETVSRGPIPSTIVSQKVSENGAVAEETLNERIVYKRRIDKAKQIEVYHKCPSGVTGQFVYDVSCNQFLDCWKGRGGPRNCAPGTLFNPKTLECDFPDKVECITGPRQNTLTARSISQKSENLVIEQVNCPEGFSGMIPNYTDCTKFIRCNNGQQNSLDCPPGTLFDFTHNICDFPEKSVCFNSQSSNPPNQYGKINCQSSDKSCYSEYREPYGYTYQENTYSPHGTYYQTSHTYGSGNTADNFQAQGFGNCNINDPSCKSNGASSLTGAQWQHTRDQITQKTFCNPQIQDCSRFSSWYQTSQQLKPNTQSTYTYSQQFGGESCNPNTQNCGQQLTTGTQTTNTYSQQSEGESCNPNFQNCANSQSSGVYQQHVNGKPCNPQIENCGQSNTGFTSGSTQNYGSFPANNQQQVNRQFICDPSLQNCNQRGQYSHGHTNTQGSHTFGYNQGSMNGINLNKGCNPQLQNCDNQKATVDQNSGFQQGSNTLGYGQGSVSYENNLNSGCNPQLQNCQNRQQDRQYGGFQQGSNVLGYGQHISISDRCNPQMQNCQGERQTHVQQNSGSGTTYNEYSGNQGGSSLDATSQVNIGRCNPNIQNCQGQGEISGSSGGSHTYNGHGQNSGNRFTSNSGSRGTYTNYQGHNQNHGSNSYTGNQNFQTVCNINDQKCQQQNSASGKQSAPSARGHVRCPNGFQGITKHPTSCKKFLNCANGITYIQDCAEGTLFNPSSGICDFPYNVDCDEDTDDTTTEITPQFNGNNNYYDYTSSTERNRFQPSYGSQFGSSSNSPCSDTNCDHQNGYDSEAERTTYSYNYNSPVTQRVRPGSVDIQNSGNYGNNNRNQYQQTRTTPETGSNYQRYSTSTTTTTTEKHIYNIPSKTKNKDNVQQVSDYVDVFDPSDNRNLHIRSTSTTRRPRTQNSVWPPPFPTTDTNADYVFEYEDGEPVTLEPENVLIGRGDQKNCGRNDFFCSSNVCVPKTVRCNGIKDCPNGNDEIDCYQYLQRFKVYNNSRLEVLEKQRWDNISFATCAILCLEAKKFECISFNYRKMDKTCFLTDKNIGLSGALREYYPCDYYELKNKSLDCSDMHICPNGKCLKSDQICNGINDCGDRADEKECRASDFGYKIKLAGGKNKNEGRIEVTVFGQTGFICDDQFDMKDANAACKDLGYELGAAEIRGNSFFAKDIQEKNTLYIMDDIQCLGNETSLLECDFPGWGIHNCKDQEIVGVVCKTREEKCGKNFWNCDTLNECVPIDFVCDGLYDCSDNSDEASQHCDAPTQLRLANGSSSNEGRVEIQHHGIWGTVCDDDFNDDAAKVVCKYFGFAGVAKVKKDGYYGAGEGPIWLDQVSCYGNETSIEQCTHWKWGEHNCEHSEDVGIVCTNDVNEVEVQRHSKAYDTNPESYDNRNAESLEPTSCGFRKDNIFLRDDNVHFRVVQGSVAKKGDYPWQAAIRVKRQEKSAHWCGAVIISSKWVLTAAHCLDGYPKGAYVVVAGEYDTDENEGTEQQAYIEEYYLHENFRQGHKMANDIALIKLKGHGFRLNQDIQPICLPDETVDYEADLNCTISGFGSIQSGSAVYSHSLRAASIPIQKMDICKMAHIYGKSITEGMICAGYLDGGVDACDGDSGGPLACLNEGVFTLYGLTSWGQRCGMANKPGVYVKVAYYRRWIDRTIKMHSR